MGIEKQLQFLEAHPEIDLASVQLCIVLFFEKPRDAAREYVGFSMKNAPEALKIPHMTKA